MKWTIQAMYQMFRLNTSWLFVLRDVHPFHREQNSTEERINTRWGTEFHPRHNSKEDKIPRGTDFQEGQNWPGRHNLLPEAGAQRNPKLIYLMVSAGMPLCHQREGAIVPPPPPPRQPPPGLSGAGSWWAARGSKSDYSSEGRLIIMAACCLPPPRARPSQATQGTTTNSRCTTYNINSFTHASQPLRKIFYSG